MAEPLMTITVDITALLAAMAAIPDEVSKSLKAAAKVTAENIAREAKSRIARRTGQTAEGIRVEEARKGDGYIVFVGNPGTGGREHVGFFLEFGTKFMSARPFLFASARLEEGPHDRRSREAVQAAIAVKGLGD